ncbi:uncharacterized protein A4U43_C04F1340 [Asparagus officinalis]|uniref:Uncharacterized protein n=1 Tax=Asparagus officinalis TaxID=4686 RepID=A0A5P1F1V7_ASPOF|nr:uncharacterized protein A4U43_C04F1340 [Asparagus officinalis]
MSLPSRSSLSDDVIIADLIAAGDQSGCESFSNVATVATPASRGADIEVPDIKLNVGTVTFPSSREAGPTGNGHAPRMLTPGPTISGFSTPSFTLLGPLDENDATDGDFGVPYDIGVPLEAAVLAKAQEITHVRAVERELSVGDCMDEAIHVLHGL